MQLLILCYGMEVPINKNIHGLDFIFISLAVQDLALKTITGLHILFYRKYHPIKSDSAYSSLHGRDYPDTGLKIPEMKSVTFHV